MTDLSGKSKMEAALHSRRSRVMLGLAAALVTMALVTATALARPAGAGPGAGLANLSNPPSSVSAASASAPSTGELVLHRDGSRAVPFVADVTPTEARSADGFDWGDAAIGLGAGLLVSALGIAAIGAHGGRRAQTA